MNGHVVPDGAYYCVVQAKGADGKNYSIKNGERFDYVRRTKYRN